MGEGSGMRAFTSGDNRSLDSISIHTRPTSASLSIQKTFSLLQFIGEGSGMRVICPNFSDDPQTQEMAGAAVNGYHCMIRRNQIYLFRGRV